MSCRTQQRPFDRIAEAFAVVAERSRLALRRVEPIAREAVARVVHLADLWRREFVHLMRAPASAFPGRHDRSIWIALVVLLPPVGAWAYHAYREGRRGEAKPAGFDEFDGPI